MSRVDKSSRSFRPVARPPTKKASTPQASISSARSSSSTRPPGPPTPQLAPAQPPELPRSPQWPQSPQLPSEFLVPALPANAAPISATPLDATPENTGVLPTGGDKDSAKARMLAMAKAARDSGTRRASTTPAPDAAKNNTIHVPVNNSGRMGSVAPEVNFFSTSGLVVQEPPNYGILEKSNPMPSSTFVPTLITSEESVINIPYISDVAVHSFRSGSPMSFPQLNTPTHHQVSLSPTLPVFSSMNQFEAPQFSDQSQFVMDQGCRASVEPQMMKSGHKKPTKASYLTSNVPGQGSDDDDDDAEGDEEENEEEQPASSKVRRKGGNSGLKPKRKRVSSQQQTDATQLDTVDENCETPRQRRKVQMKRRKASKTSTVDPVQQALLDELPVDPMLATMESICDNASRGRVSEVLVERMNKVRDRARREKEERKAVRLGSVREDSVQQGSRSGSSAPHPTNSVRGEVEDDDGADAVSQGDGEPESSSRKSVKGTPQRTDHVNAHGETDGEEENAPAPALYAPRLRLLNGKMVVDEESLQVDRTQHIEERLAQMDEVEGGDETRLTNSASWGKHQRGERWTAEDTDMFYDAIRIFGTDFEMISKLFPTRTRSQIRRQWNRAEKSNPEALDAALTGRSKKKLELIEYGQAIGKDFTGPIPIDPTEVWKENSLKSQGVESRDCAEEHESENSVRDQSEVIVHQDEHVEVETSTDAEAQVDGEHVDVQTYIGTEAQPVGANFKVPTGSGAEAQAGDESEDEIASTLQLNKRFDCCTIFMKYAAN